MNNQLFQNQLITGNLVPFPTFNSGYGKNRGKTLALRQEYIALLGTDERYPTVQRESYKEQKIKKQLEVAKSLEPAQIQQQPKDITEISVPRKSLSQKRLLKVKKVAPLDFTKEMNWLEKYRTEFSGEWVALDGDRLVSHGLDGLEVYKAARRTGVESPFLVQVELEDELPFGGW